MKGYIEDLSIVVEAINNGDNKDAIKIIKEIQQNMYLDSFIYRK